MLAAIQRYFVDSFHEIKKVSWPTKNQTKNYTLIVIGLTLAMAIFLGALDLGLSRLLEFLIA